MRFWFLILLVFVGLSCSATAPNPTAEYLAQELGDILTQIERNEATGTPDETYVYERGSFRDQLAKTAISKKTISPGALKKANESLYRLDTMKRKTIIFLSYVFYSEKINKQKPDVFIKSVLSTLLEKKQSEKANANVLVCLLVYSQKASDKDSTWSYNVYNEMFSQSYDLDEACGKDFMTTLRKEVKAKRHLMSKDPDDAITYRADLLWEKLKGCKKSEGILTLDVMTKLFPDSPLEKLKHATKTINKFAPQFGIDSKKELVHFIAQTGYESGGFAKIPIEGSCYSRSGIVSVFKSKTWNDVSQVSESKGSIKCPDFDSEDDIPDKYVCIEEGSNVKKTGAGKYLFSYVYRSEYENGDEDSQEGYKYRGRGIIQLTFKGNYRAFNEYIKTKYQQYKTTDLLAIPDLVSNDAELATISAMWFWGVLHDLNGYAQNDNLKDFKALTKTINYKKEGIKDRLDIVNKAKDLYGLGNKFQYE